jgi:nitroreductase
MSSYSISKDILEKLVNSARLAPSGANLQPLEFVAIDDEELRNKLFSCLRWAAYIVPEGNPKPGCEPTAYVVILVNLDIRKSEYERDVGAAVENMILAAWEKSIGSCWIANADTSRIQKMLRIPENYKVDSVLALGYPDEEPRTEEMKDSVKYWKDSKGQLYVPKRRIEDVLHFNGF